MENTLQKARRVWTLLFAIITLFALGLQLYIIIDNVPDNGLTVPGAIVRFLSFFTVLSNLLVAICITSPLVQKKTTKSGFFSRLSVQSAILVYILVVGLVYNLVLRNLWNPQGRDLLADELLHVVVPLLYMVHWFLFRPGGILKWKDKFPWLIFPMAYLIYSLVSGSITGWYPYPFLNINQLGVFGVILNILLIIALFLLISFIVIFANRSLKRA